MPEYKAVPGGHAISKKIADLLEDINSQLYNGMNRAETIREINDILHGRSDTSVDMLLSMLNEQGGSEYAERIGELRGQIEAFFLQKVLRSWPYTRIGNQEYQYKTWDFLTDRPLKVIDQRIFDHAVENGFPPDFFKESYFDQVTIYCMPDGADCSFSNFRDCAFSVCGMRGAVFDNASIYDTDFHSSLLHMVNFTSASIANSHFWDCSLASVSFQDARLKSCLTVDCSMDQIDFQGATLDGSSYGRIKAKRIMNLPSVTITQGGATAAEVQRLRISTFRELGVSMFPVKQRSPSDRRRKPSAPER